MNHGRVPWPSRHATGVTGGDARRDSRDTRRYPCVGRNQTCLGVRSPYWRGPCVIFRRKVVGPSRHVSTMTQPSSLPILFPFSPFHSFREGEGHGSLVSSSKVLHPSTFHLPEPDSPSNSGHVYITDKGSRHVSFSHFKLINKTHPPPLGQPTRRHAPNSLYNLFSNNARSSIVLSTSTSTMEPSLHSHARYPRLRLSRERHR